MRVFIADYLPLANKGEEEILRGIETLFKSRENMEMDFSVFGDVSNTIHIDNVTVYPKSICYPDYGYSSRKRTLISIFWGILDIIGYYPYKKSLCSNNQVMGDLKESDTILIGHDGFFNIRCAMLGNFLHKKGFSYAILGAGFSRPSRKIAWIYDKVYKKCFDNAKYIVLRERTAYNYVMKLSKNDCIKLYPDPAFFCPDDAYDKQRIEDVLLKYGINKEQGLKIGVTVCEDSISFSHAFVESKEKENEHRIFIAELMRKINQKHKCVFYFLPHCIKDGKGNDLAIAKDIIRRLDKTVCCKIIEEDLPVLDLKHIISIMDIVIGERTHSIINSISTATPFVSLTCSADFRTHDIVGDGCGLPHQIYDMDYPDCDNLFNLINKTIENRQILSKQLQIICKNNESIKKDIQEIL